MTNQKAAKVQAKLGAETAKEGAERTGIAAPSLNEVEKARAEGVTDAIKEQAKDAYTYATDGQLPGDPAAAKQYIGHDDITLWAPNLSLGVEPFEQAIDASAPVPIPEEKVYGLLALERNGQNRTPYVRAMMKRLNLKADQLPGGGPGYTNPVNSLDEL